MLMHELLVVVVSVNANKDKRIISFCKLQFAC